MTAGKEVMLDSGEHCRQGELWYLDYAFSFRRFHTGDKVHRKCSVAVSRCVPVSVVIKLKTKTRDGSAGLARGWNAV